MAQEKDKWTIEDDDQLFVLRDQGLPFSQIAAIMNRTKNALIGRYGRQRKIRDGESVANDPVIGVPLTQVEIDRILELRKTGMVTPAIAKEVGRSQQTVWKYIKRFTAATEVRNKVVNLAPSKEYKSSKREAYQSFAASGGVTLMELTTRTCRWPVGDPRHDDFRFCGDYAEPGRVYCCPHHALAYYRAAVVTKNAKQERSRETPVA